MNKNPEKILNDSRLQGLSLTPRITTIAILVLELRKPQVDAVVLSRT